MNARRGRPPQPVPPVEAAALEAALLAVDTAAAELELRRRELHEAMRRARVAGASVRAIAAACSTAPSRIAELIARG